jgi:site-specific DNA-methyltransferase (cytosine-N4-specific)
MSQAIPERIHWEPAHLLAIEERRNYLKRCAETGMKPHPARFPVQMPEHFIKFLTDEGDLVLDPFAGSCTTGWAAERLRRRWMAFEMQTTYLDGAKFRFETEALEIPNEASPEAPRRYATKQAEMAL